MASPCRYLPELSTGWMENWMTFTFRISAILGQNLSSAQMRTWIAEFLRQPHPLPPDPGPGDGRISLTLESEAVHALAGFLTCSPSSALRRLAAERLAFGPKSVQSPPPKPAVSRATSIAAQLRTSAAARTRLQHRPGLSRITRSPLKSSPPASPRRVSDSMTSENSGWQIALLLAPAAAFLAWLFLGSWPGIDLE
jgi:hypothetical protein